jgi:hypothetical protein
MIPRHLQTLFWDTQLDTFQPEAILIPNRRQYTRWGPLTKEDPSEKEFWRVWLAGSDSDKVDFTRSQLESKLFPGSSNAVIKAQKV